MFGNETEHIMEILGLFSNVKRLIEKNFFSTTPGPLPPNLRAMYLLGMTTILRRLSSLNTLFSETH